MHPYYQMHPSILSNASIYPLNRMELDKRKQRVLERLENSIGITNDLLIEINQELEEMNEEIAPLIQMAETYDIWVSKA